MENLEAIWKEYKGERIKKGDVVLDLGSSEGYFSKWATIQGAEVFSVDARVNYAVGPEDGFCEVRGETLGAFIVPNQGTTPMRSLKSLIDEIGEIDFLKCDIEGGEYEIFNCDLSKVKFIAIEFHVWTVKGEPEVSGLGIKEGKRMPKNAVDNLIKFLEKTHKVEVVGDKKAGGYIYAERS